MNGRARDPSPDPGTGGPTERRRRRGGSPFLWGLLLFLGLYWIARGALAPRDGVTVAYSLFRTEAAGGNVVAVTVEGSRITGSFREPIERVAAGGDTTSVADFVTYVPSFGDPELLALLRAGDVEVRTLPEGDSSWIRLLVWGVLPLVFLGGLLFVLMRRLSGPQRSLFSLARSGARRYRREASATTFDDVGGARGAKVELREIADFLEEPQRFRRLGAEVPKGVLLVGPPGTGKTLLARAVAGEADVPFFIITGSDFMEMLVGVGAKRVRDLFARAKSEAPSIIFIDELDSIGRHRGAGLGGGHDEREQTLNQLLSELDGFEPAENVIVMAATNRPDILDPALLRPGRFDRRITVDLPSAGERLEILRLHARDLPLHPEVELEPVASGTPGFSGADLKNLLNEAALTAARENRSRIAPQHIEAARDRILLGLEREGLALTEDEVELLAYHEAGHALLGAVLPTSDPVHKVTIVPRGRSMGSTHQLPERERYVWRREQLLDRLTTLLGGRAAETLVFDTMTSGAEDDLRAATSLARRMILRWGMSDALGPFAASSAEGEVFLGEQIGRPRDHSEATAKEVDDEVRRVLRAAAERAERILEERREDLDRLADLLREREEITGDDVRRVLDSTVEGEEGERPAVAR